MRLSRGEAGRQVMDQRALAAPDNVARLRLARAARGQTQAQCAAALRELGVRRVSQATISEWERGITRPSAPTLTAIDAYVVADQSQTPRQSPTTAVHAPRPDFDALVRDFSGEPLLGPTQADLVKAVIERLRTGPPLTQADVQAVEIIAKVLRAVP